ncbi:hypothetical protein [Ralstonia pseudosolanacearum]|uniref:hypothetical protein n=1 Tax=Ralstonia pseudosolanacearum TaxID=1310165 RepID=UPI0018D1D264|nr:hypothetical protein [Ralstonia pseudosolanacearum]
MLACAVEKKIYEKLNYNSIGKEDPQSDLKFLACIESVDLESLTKNTRNNVLAECRRLRMLAEMDLWSDVPKVNTASTVEAITGPERFNEEPDEQDVHLPLPDEYVAEMGRKSLWITRNLAPNLLEITARMAEIWERTARLHASARTIGDTRRKEVKKLLNGYRWRDSDGRRFESLPFPLRLPTQLKFEIMIESLGDMGDSRWPPQSYRDVLGLLAVVQTAHYFIVALCMGARRSETLGLQRNCVVDAVDGRRYADGKTYKLVQHAGGVSRDWLLPDVAIAAIELQVRLLSAVGQISRIKPHAVPITVPEVRANLGKSHLWAQISASGSSDATKPLGDINTQLQSYAQRLQMDVAPCGQNLRSHRFRKTLARLVALALTQAPKLLMDVFGHKSIEMTLYYILTDKDLRAEIETVSRELRVMRAKEVVEKMVEADLAPEGQNAQLGGYGGLAAISLHSAVEIHRQSVHRRGTDWNADSAIELAELLTLQGKAWEQVRTGVICTKLPGEAGPCNKRKGRPEPSKCQSSCTHRLEEAFLREDVEGAIEAAVAGYEQAIVNEEALTAAHWAGQVRANVPRFPDLCAKWSTNETVRTLMAKQELKEHS